MLFHRCSRSPAKRLTRHNNIELEEGEGVLVNYKLIHGKTKFEEIVWNVLAKTVNAPLPQKVIRYVHHSRHYYLTHRWGVVLAPPICFSVVDFSKNRGNHVKVSTSLGLLLAHLDFLSRPVDLLLQERYITCSSLLPP